MTREIDSPMYAARRAAFTAHMKAGIALFPAAPLSTRSNDVEYRYRQDSNLYYLTGFPEPESLCLLSPQHEKEGCILFVRPRDKDKETWTGRRFGVEGAKEVFGVDATYPIEKLDEVLAEHMVTAETVYYALGRDERMNAKVLELMQRCRLQRPRSGRGPTSLIDPGEIVHEQRLCKSAEELALMRKAVAASTAAHHAAMTQTRPGMYEYEIEAALEFHFRRHGASGPAYPSIVASGANATILHYTTNDCRMRDGDLLLIDAAAEYGCYCSDVTRTFPVAARFSSVQREVYSLVLAAQQQTIDMIRPGVRIDDLHQHATEVLIDGLRAFGLLSGATSAIIEKGEHRRFYMHRTSHWLGMDVHDAGTYKLGEHSRALEPGMVLTVEPGIYIAEDAEGVEDRYRGIGIRIEDDVLVTSAGHEVLTAAIPKAIDDIEALRRGA